MGKLKELAGVFAADEKGLETVEYAIIIGIIVVGLLALIPSIGAWVNGKFTEMDTTMSSTNPPGP